MKRLSVMILAIMVAMAVMAEVTITYDTCTIDGVTGARVTSVSGDDKSIEVPSTYNGRSVIAIGAGAFKNNTTVQRIVLPETVKEIQSDWEKGGAFDGCIALTTCNIPSGVTEIPYECFSGCRCLRKIELPAGLKSIYTDAFSGCHSLTQINFPDGLERIGSHAFNSCYGLKSVELPDSVITIDDDTYGAWAPSGTFGGCSGLEKVRLSSKITMIPTACFSDCSLLQEINIPVGVTNIDSSAFGGCRALKVLTVPDTVTSVDSGTFYGVGRVVFLGKPPVGVQDASISISLVEYPKQYGALWQACFGIDKMGGFVKAEKPVVTVLSAAMRQNQPGVMDVVYKVTSTKPTVKVRALAFKDGVRSFVNVIRPETFVNGSGVGDSVSANVAHTISWNVAADCTNELANLTVEIFAVEDDVLPLELMKIPANGNKKAMEISWNVLSEIQVLDALFWYYADHAADLTLAGGVLKNGDETLVEGATVKTTSYLYSDDRGWVYSCYAPEYLFSKMGFSLLSGAELEYANSMTRMGLSPNGLRQYAYRWIDGQ